jgi:hypothetical protein
MDNAATALEAAVGPYSNNKSKQLYEVLDIVVDATNGANDRLMVLYRPLHGFRKYVRCSKEFSEKFTKVNDGFHDKTGKEEIDG